MPTVKIEGIGRVKVGDGFLSMTPAQQHAAIEEIASKFHIGELSKLSPPIKAKSVFDHIDDVVRSLAGGMSFGFADELAAKANELIGRGTYEQNLKEERARDADISPWVRIPGEMTGAVMSTIASAPVTGPAAVMSGMSRLPAAVRYTGVGGAQGALMGAGNAEPGLNNRMAGALTGGAIGAPVGYAAPYVVAGASRLMSGVRNSASSSANMSTDLGRAMLRDAAPAAELEARTAINAIDRPGVASLADAGGENVVGLLERVAQTPGAGRTIAIPALTQRQTGQLSRVSDDLRGLTGTDKTARQAVEETIAERAIASKPLYDEAMSFNARSVPQVAQAFDGEIGSGWGKAILNSKNLKLNLQTEYGIKNPMDAPLMVLIDAWKKTADDLVAAAYRSGDNNRARVVDGMVDRVLKVVDAHNPAYARARDAWAGPSKFLEAIESGKNILTRGADEVIGDLAKFGSNQSLLEAYRIGGVSTIIKKMGSDPAKLADMTKYLRSPEMREKVASIMPTPEAAASWKRRLDFEVRSSEIVGRSLGNSATYRRQAERADADGIAADLVLGALSGAPITSLWHRILVAAPQALRDTLRSKSDRLLAEVLTDPAKVNQLRSILGRAEGSARPLSDRALYGSIASAEAAVN